MILLDTSVLSLAYRRRTPPQGDREMQVRDTFARLIAVNRPLAVPGIVVQELLAGIRTPLQFEVVLADLRSFHVMLATEEDHLAAARIMSACAASGVVAKNLDCLIAAQAVLSGGELYTTDTDFDRIATVCALGLFRP